MTSKNLEIKTAVIEVKVIRVDGHKMTKAVFRQIPIDDPFTTETEDNGQSRIVLLSCADVLGWVNDGNEIWWLYTQGGSIFKFCLETRMAGRRIGLEVSVDGYWRPVADVEYHASMARLKNKYSQLFIAT
jgi:hypothetical protein